MRTQRGRTTRGGLLPASPAAVARAELADMPVDPEPGSWPAGRLMCRVCWALLAAAWACE